MMDALNDVSASQVIDATVLADVSASQVIDAAVLADFGAAPGDVAALGATSFGLEIGVPLILESGLSLVIEDTNQVLLRSFTLPLLRGGDGLVVR